MASTKPISKTERKSAGGRTLFSRKISRDADGSIIRRRRVFTRNKLMPYLDPSLLGAGSDPNKFSTIIEYHGPENVSEDVQMSSEKIDDSRTTALANSKQNEVAAGTEVEPQSNDSEDLKARKLIAEHTGRSEVTDEDVEFAKIMRGKIMG